MLTHGDTHSHVKTVLAFLIFLLAASVFFVFYSNQDNILVPGRWQMFITLAVVGMALLIGLLFLVSNSDTRGRVKTARASSRAVSKPKAKTKSTKKKRK